MKRLKRMLHRALRPGTAVFIAALLFAGSCGRGEDAAPETPPAVDYYSLVRSADKLVLSEMSINKMATLQDLKLDQAKGGRQTVGALVNMFKIGTRKGAYSYNTYLRAYIDLSELRPEDVQVDTAAKVMRIQLPPVRTEFAGRDVEVREDHYRVTGLRSDISAEERARVKEAMNEALKREVEERSGFRDRLRLSARDKANSYFTALAAEQGLAAEITFK
ncbi:MAG: DUF4230 domain-containing protein [Muribaculaceae bacterium]|nr:DUF4230 domain-containing protein [Muribaculaceae bacterium]